MPTPKPARAPASARRERRRESRRRRRGGDAASARGNASTPRRERRRRRVKRRRTRDARGERGGGARGGDAARRASARCAAEREADSAAKEATTLRERCALLERNAGETRKSARGGERGGEGGGETGGERGGETGGEREGGETSETGKPRTGKLDEGGGETAAGSKSLRQLRVSLRQLRPRFRVVRRGDARVGVRRRRVGGVDLDAPGSRVANDGYSRRNAWTPRGVSTPPSPTREETRRRPSRSG